MKSWITTLLVFAAALSPLSAAENGGLLVDVQKISLERHDEGHGDYTKVGRTMTLKINIRNNSLKDMPETTLKYVILVQKWGTHRIERSEGDIKLEKLPASRSVTVNAGEIGIKGYMDGTSDRDVDRIAGWKITIPRDGHILEFVSGSTFETLNQRVGKRY